MEPPGLAHRQVRQTKLLDGSPSKPERLLEVAMGFLLPARHHLSCCLQERSYLAETRRAVHPTQREALLAGFRPRQSARVLRATGQAPALIDFRLSATMA
jgi:hypothetical protein